MKRFLSCAGSLLFIGTGCPSDDGDKAVVDEAALSQGVTVTLVGALGTLQVPFAEPVETGVSWQDFDDAMTSAVTLVVSSPRTGVSANLTEGQSVMRDPGAPGEFTWLLNEDHDLATLSFYNRTVSSGEVLLAGETYEAQLSIATNDYVESLPATAIPVAVQ